MAVPFMFLQDSLNVMLKGKMYNIRKDSPEYEDIKEAIKNNQDEDFIYDIVDKAQALIKRAHGKIEIQYGEVFFNGYKCEGPIVDRILFMADEGIDLSPIENFLVNLEKNPSRRSVEELYTFLEKCNLPITEDGYFLAYKKVREDWMDLYSGTVSNVIGAKPRMSRNKVDDDFRVGCSKGYHVASKEYYNESGYGSGDGNRLIVVKVNPEDVVSVPEECNFTKMRVCAYEVIMEVADYSIPSKYAPNSYSSPEDEEDEVDGEDNSCPGCCPDCDDYDCSDRDDDFDDDDDDDDCMGSCGDCDAPDCPDREDSHNGLSC